MENHPVYEAVHGLENADPEIRKQWEDGYDANLEALRESEDALWLEQAMGICMNNERPKVIVDPKLRDEIGKASTPFDVAAAKAAEDRKYAVSISRKGNAADPAKLKQKNRTARKAAAKSKKRNRK